MRTRWVSLPTNDPLDGVAFAALLSSRPPDVQTNFLAHRTAVVALRQCAVYDLAWVGDGGDFAPPLNVSSDAHDAITFLSSVTPLEFVRNFGEGPCGDVRVCALTCQWAQVHPCKYGPCARWFPSVGVCPVAECARPSLPPSPRRHPLH